MTDYLDYVPEARVSHLMTPAGGDATNQFVIETPDATIFQSYDSLIAIRVRNPQSDEPRVIIGPRWDCSNTTMKYLKQFLGHGAAVTRKRIEDGTYQFEENLA